MALVPIKPNIGVCYVLREIRGQTQVLLLKRANFPSGIWCHIAGGIEEGERAWQCALREVYEETGLRPQRLYSAEILETFYEAPKDQITSGVVFVAYVSEDAHVEINQEHTDFGWFGFDEAIEKVEFVTQRQILQHIREEFVLRAPSKFSRIEIHP